MRACACAQGLKADANKWQEEDFLQYTHRASSGTHVEVDAHIICTPAIADIDGDGHDELVVATSHFFDREYYDDPVSRRSTKHVLTLVHCAVFSGRIAGFMCVCLHTSTVCAYMEVYIPCSLHRVHFVMCVCVRVGSRQGCERAGHWQVRGGGRGGV